MNACHQRGSALLIALLAVALATVLAVGLIERGQSTLARTQALMSTERAYQFALGMETMARDLLAEALAGGVEPALLNGTWTVPYEVPGGMVQGRLLDQDARFNLNALANTDQTLAGLARERFERLLVHLGLNPVLAVELADWIDGAPTPRPGSAGDGWYGGQRPAYRQAGLPLVHVSELRWLRSMDEAAYERLVPVVTALPQRDLLVNINTTSAPVLASLIEGLDLDQARRVLADAPYGDVGTFMTHPVIAPLAPPGLEMHLTISSRWYLAQARVTLDGIERDYFRLLGPGASGYDFRYFSQGVP